MFLVLLLLFVALVVFGLLVVFVKALVLVFVMHACGNVGLVLVVSAVCDNAEFVPVVLVCGNVGVMPVVRRRCRCQGLVTFVCLEARGVAAVVIYRCYVCC